MMSSYSYSLLAPYNPAGMTTAFSLSAYFNMLSRNNAALISSESNTRFQKGITI